MNYPRFFISLSVVIALLCAAALSASFSTAQQNNITFSKHVAPIFYKNCVACHRPGESAPMSLMTYKDARPWAKSIREKVVSRQMPPWHADPQFGAFANDARLSQDEINTIVAWVAQGAKEGDANDLPPAPTFASDWKIGKPDLIVAMPEEHTIAADAPDENYNAYAEVVIPTDRWVQAVEFRPGNTRVVHHSHVFVETPKPAAATASNTAKPETKKPRVNYTKRVGQMNYVRDDAPVIDNGCGTPDGGMFPGERPQELSIIVSYLPGKAPEVWKSGYAKLLPAGSKLRFSIHYARGTGQVEKDRSSIGLIFAKEPPTHPVHRLDIHNMLFRVPAGADNHEVTACYTFERDVEVLTLLPHMHYRGKAMRFDFFFPDGRKETLLNVPSYDFNWQRTYYLKQPRRIPKGTRLMLTAVFDNSAKNKYNPDASNPVRWGTPSEAEMMDGWIEYIVATTRPR